MPLLPALDSAQAYFNRGEDLHKKERYREAIADYSEAIKLVYSFASAFNNRGFCYYKLEQYGKAIKDYTQAIRYKPTFAVAYNNRGTVYRIQGRYQEAIFDFTKAIEHKPNSAKGYSNRASAYRDSGHYKYALQDYSRANALEPGNASVFYNKGQIYHQQGKCALAITQYSKAVQLKHDYASAYKERGSLYYASGQFDKAINDFSLARKYGLTDPEILCKRGQAYFKLRNYNAAIDNYSRALLLQPNSAETYCLRGASYCMKQKYAAAINDYSEAIRLNPHSAQYYSNRGYAHSMNSDLGSAIRDFTQTILLDERNANSYYNRGIARSNLGSYQEALHDFAKAIELKLRYFEAYLHRGIAYTNVQQDEIAIKDFEQAIRINPKFAEAYYQLAGAYYRQGNSVEAHWNYLMAIHFGFVVTEGSMSRKFSGKTFRSHTKSIKETHTVLKPLLNTTSEFHLHEPVALTSAYLPHFYSRLECLLKQRRNDLTHLTLSKCITNDNIDSFISAFKACGQLALLVLSHNELNQLPSEAIQRLFHALRGYQKLATFDLSGNQLSMQNIEQHLCELVADVHLPKLSELRLADNRFRAIELKALLRSAIAHPQLKRIDLTANAIDIENAEYVEELRTDITSIAQPGIFPPLCIDIALNLVQAIGCLTRQAWFCQVPHGHHSGRQITFNSRIVANVEHSSMICAEQTISRESWLVFVYRVTNARDTEHTNLAIEGIKKGGQRFLISYDFRPDGERPGFGRVYGPKVIDPMRSNFNAGCWCYHGFLVPRVYAKLVKGNAVRDQGQTLEYGSLGNSSKKSSNRRRYNCLTWALAKCREAGLNVSRSRAIPIPSTYLKRSKLITPALPPERGAEDGSCVIQ